MSYEDLFSQLFGKAGITINGNNAYDIQIHDKRTYKRILTEANLGLGESYMDGWWDCQRLDEFTARIFLADIYKVKPNLKMIMLYLSAKLTNQQSIRKAKEVSDAHYDLDNDLFQKFLDPGMVYTCAYWKNASNLEEAQIAKMDMICRKLEFKPGMKVLDIGCGWGSFMRYASEKYGVECTGYTISQKQVLLGEKLCQGLDVKFILDDYRNISGKFDRVVSIGMFEAVGYKNFRTFMEICANALRKDGAMLLHTMGGNESYTYSDPWYDKYIFPNGMVPSIAQIGKATEGLMIIEDLHNIGPDYDKTLMAWNENFQKNWPLLKERYSERFKRMWEFYLLQVAGTFRSRGQQLWQIVLSHPGSKQINCRDYEKKYEQSIR